MNPDLNPITTVAQVPAHRGLWPKGPTLLSSSLPQTGALEALPIPRAPHHCCEPELSVCWSAAQGTCTCTGVLQAPWSTLQEPRYQYGLLPCPPPRTGSRHPMRGPSQRPQAGCLHHILWALPPPWASVAGTNVSRLRTPCEATAGHAFLCRANKKCSGIPLSPNTSSPPAMTGWGINSSAPSPWLRALGCVYPTWLPGGPRGTKLHSPPAFTGCLSFPVLLPHPHWCFPESPPEYISGAAPGEPLKDKDGQDVLPEACPTDSLPLPPSLPPTTPASPSLALEPSSSHSSSRGRLQAPRSVLGLSLLLWVF